MAQFAFCGTNMGVKALGAGVSYSEVYFLLNQDVWLAESTGVRNALIVGAFRSTRYGGVDIPDQGLPSNLRGATVKFKLEGGPAWGGGGVTKLLKLELSGQTQSAYSWEGRVELMSSLMFEFRVEGLVRHTNARGGFKDAMLFGGFLVNVDDLLEEEVARQAQEEARQARHQVGVIRGAAGQAPTMARRLRPR